MNYTYDMFLDSVRHIAEQIEFSGEEYDYIIGLARGGLVPAVKLSHKLDIPMLAVNWQTRDSLFRHIDPAIKTKLHNKRILIVDDIVDSGETIKLLKEELNMVTQLDVAALIYNTEQEVDCKFFDVTIKRSIDPSWVYFWWES